MYTHFCLFRKSTSIRDRIDKKNIKKTAVKDTFLGKSTMMIMNIYQNQNLYHITYSYAYTYFCLFRESRRIEDGTEKLSIEKVAVITMSTVPCILQCSGMCNTATEAITSDES